MNHPKKTIPDLIQEIELDVGLLVKAKHKQFMSLLIEEPFLFHADIERQYFNSVKSEVLLMLVELSKDYTAEEYMIELEDMDWSNYL